MLNIIRSELTLSVFERGIRKELTVPVSFIKDPKRWSSPAEILDIDHATVALQKTPLGLSDPNRVYRPSDEDTKRLMEDLEALGVTKPILDAVTKKGGVKGLTGVYNLQPEVRKSFLATAVGDEKSLHPLQELIVLLPGVPGSSRANVQFSR